MRFEYEKVIVGNSLTALAAAYYEGVPVLVQGRPQYFFFDYFQSPDTRCSQVWMEAAFQLSMAGLMPFGHMIESIRTEEETELEIITSDGKRHQVSCEDCETISRSIVLGAGNEYREVIDWFNVVSGRVHDFNSIEVSTTEPLRKLLFYPTKRYHGPNLYKDVIARSFMFSGEEDLEQNSELIFRFATENAMKAAGIRGRKNGFTEDGKQKYLNINIEHEKRVVRPFYRPEEVDIVIRRSAVSEMWYSEENKEISKLAKQFGDPFGRAG